LNVLAEEFGFAKKDTGREYLTPHMKEFDRLFGEHTSWWQRLQTAKGES
jgi:NAD(P)H-hydrate repair Nnr-like enzyme with NAD(P)H-hydrate dehydratase domain